MACRRRPLIATATVLAALVGCSPGAPPERGAHAFPSPDRPVAPIISPAYSSEAERDRAGEADRVLERLDIRPGLRVADIGAGDGYYTVRVARRLGPGATVYAEDVTAEYLERLASRLAAESIAGVTLIRGDPADPKLPPGSVDVAILGHVYHEIENPYEFLYRLWPALAPGARVAVIDVDRPTRDHGTPPALLRCEMGAVGYRQVDFLALSPADGYLATFVPPAELPPVSALRPCVLEPRTPRAPGGPRLWPGAARSPAGEPASRVRVSNGAD